jgi:hypothetical protein
MSRRQAVWIAGIAWLLIENIPLAQAKPIAFANGTSLMAEYGGNTMREAQVFYAPRFDLSLGGGYVRLASDIDGRTREISYVRVNYLPKRWNLESAQANVFVWGGLGSARISERGRSVFAQNVGVQFDYETRRVYVSAKTDLQRADEFAHRIDTLQFGVAPYAHDYDTLATWLLLQARRYSGGLYDGTETAVMLRLFKGNKWLEAGVTNDGKLQAMFMFNF